MVPAARIEIEAIYISPGHDFKGRFGQTPLRHETPSVSEINCVEGKGIEGDRFYGYKEDFKGQITFIERSTIDAVAAAIGAEALDPSVFRRNVVTGGVDLNTLIGKTFRIGDAVFSGSEECAPCFWMDEVIKRGAMDTMKGKGGLRCRILKTGTLRVGSASIEILSLEE